MLNVHLYMYTYVLACTCVSCLDRSLLEAGGVERLMAITRRHEQFSPRVVKFASQVLYSMWVHQELRDVYQRAGWREQDFVTSRSIAARNAQQTSYRDMNSTLNRPMASQGGTRYEDRTIRRGGGGGGSSNSHATPSKSAYKVCMKVFGSWNEIRYVLTVSTA